MQIVNFPGAGIVLGGGAKNNTIGGDRSVGSGPVGQGNLTSGNVVGIDLCDEGTSLNIITGNLIGTDTTGADAWGNHKGGIWVEDGVSRNTIGPGNIIAYNAKYGIEIAGSNSFGNTITQNSIHDNEGRGIYLWGGGNTELSVPFILDFDLAAGTLAGIACANCTVEMFSDGRNQGEVYEGKATADDTGVFTFNKGAPFAGTRLTATATDVDGNTSEFSIPASATRVLMLQEGNDLPKFHLQRRPSNELADNHIGVYVELPYMKSGADSIFTIGYKWVRVEMDKYGDWWDVDWSNPADYLDPQDDKAITVLANNGVNMVAGLGVGVDFLGKHDDYGRFKTEEEIQQYLNYLRFIVCHFKSRIQYYELWNEPDVYQPDWYIELPNYLNLVRRAVPVIREEYPEAKIVVGSTLGVRKGKDREYMFGILRSDIMPLVDAVSWHPMYGTSPEYEEDVQYYYEYPSIVQEIKDTASDHGFEGEYIADELNWSSPRHIDPAHPSWIYSESKAAKYYARAIVMHQAMDVTANIISWGAALVECVVQNLCTVMAGAEPADFPIEIQTEATIVASYSFSLPNGDKLIALWTDDVAVDDDPGVNTTVTIPAFSAQKVMGIDVLNGFEQELVTSVEDGNLVIQNLLVKDYPIILRLTK